MNVHHISKKNFHDEVLSSEKKVLLDFWAPWCTPCRMLGEVLEEVAAERPDVKVCKINVDEEYELAVRYKIVSIPAMVVMDGGVMEDKVIGFRPKQEVLSLLA